jgi:hypothetical protein
MSVIQQNSMDNYEIPSLEYKKLSKEAISSQGNKIRLVDTDPDNKLDLYCYVRCMDNSNQIVKSCRGTITLNSKVILQTYGYTHEYTSDNVEHLKKLCPDLSKLIIHDAHEGSLLRVFNINNTWYVTTHRKLDAFRSKWASRQSFGEQFVNAVVSEYENNIEFKSRVDSGDNKDVKIFTLKNSEHVSNEIVTKFFSTLDKDKCYCFLVRNTIDNRIVCKNPPRPILYHSGTFKKNVFDYFSLDEDIGIPSPGAHSFDTWDSLVDFVDNNISKDNLQGLIIFDGKNHLKVLNKDYKYFFNVRGNEPSVKYRYLQVRMDKTSTDDLYELYPRFTDQFEMYENILYQIAKSVYDSYVERFIRKKYVTLPKEEYQIMRACHSWHLEDRVKNRMNLRKVIEKMNEQTPTNLNKMIRHVMQEEKNTDSVKENIEKED